MDSIAVTYALMGPFMAIIRPIAAILTATFTGLFVNAFDANEEPKRDGLGSVSQLTPFSTQPPPSGGG